MGGKLSVAGTGSVCQRGETYDSELEACAPDCPLPVPIVPEIYDTSVPECESFYHHTCGGWIKEHSNQDRSFSFAARRNEAVLARLVRSPSSGPLYRLYRSCLDTLVYKLNAKDDNLQRDHVMADVLGEFRSVADMPVVLGKLARYGFTGPFSMSIEKYPTKPLLVPLFRPDTFGFATTEANITALFRSAGRLPLPPGRMAALRVMLGTLAAWQTQAEEPADYAAYIATQLAADTFTFGELMDMTARTGGDVFWIQYLRELDGHALDTMADAQELVWLMDKAYFGNLFQEDTFTHTQWTDYITLSVLEGTARFSPLLSDNVYFKKHDRAPIGPHVQLEHRMKRNHSIDAIDEEHCVRTAHSLLPGVTAHYYLQQLSLESGEDLRTAVIDMASKMKATFGQLIGQTSWMDSVTKARAQQKISKMIIRAVHPTHWARQGAEPFAERIAQDRWLRNLNMIRRYRSERNYGLWKSRDPLDRDTIQRFGRPLSEVNAFYSPVTNTITIFAGILTPPFFHLGFSPAAAYARIGSVIGHEMSHGLDNNGRLFDEAGSFSSWWSANATDEFWRRATALAAEYPAPAGCNNSNYGRQTLGEAIADSVGFTLAYQSFVTNATTYDEKRDFYRSYAQMWCASYSQARMCSRVEADEHAVPHMRVDKSLRQDAVFKEIFGCPVGSGMVNGRGRVTMYGI